MLSQVLSNKISIRRVRFIFVGKRNLSLRAPVLVFARKHGDVAISGVRLGEIASPAKQQRTRNDGGYKIPPTNVKHAPIAVAGAKMLAKMGGGRYRIGLSLSVKNV